MAEFRCKAMQMSDQKVCRACNLVWDMNDEDPPACKGDTNDFHVAHPPREPGEYRRKNYDRRRYDG